MAWNRQKWSEQQNDGTKSRLRSGAEINQARLHHSPRENAIPIITAGRLRHTSLKRWFESETGVATARFPRFEKARDDLLTFVEKRLKNETRNDEKMTRRAANTLSCSWSKLACCELNSPVDNMLPRALKVSLQKLHAAGNVLR